LPSSPYPGADFASEEAYKVYVKHPAHLELINRLIKPIIQPGTRTAVQFSIVQSNL